MSGVMGHQAVQGRPDVIALNFPHIDWVDSLGRSFRENAMWIFDPGRCEYRLPETSFRMKHVAHIGCTGRWCITDGAPGLHKGLLSVAIVFGDASPTESLSYGDWIMKIQPTDEAVVFGPVSCHAMKNGDVCSAVEAYITRDTVGIADIHDERFQELELLVAESLKNLQGSVVLPWLKRSLPHFAQGLQTAVNKKRFNCFGFIAMMLSFTIDSRLILPLDQSLLHPGAETFAKILLSMNRDWSRHRIAQGNAMFLLSTLLKQERSWVDIILTVGLTAGHVLSFVTDAATAATTADSLEVGLGHCCLLLELLRPNLPGPDVVAIRYAADGLRLLVRKLLENSRNQETSPWWVTDLVTCLRLNRNTASLVREEETAAAEPEWWANLTDEQRDMLNDEADDSFRCVITSEVMREPVTLVASGEIYERSAIRRYLEGVRGEKRDPRTNVPIGNDTTLVPNNTLQRQIRSWCEERIKDAIKIARLS